MDEDELLVPGDAALEDEDELEDDDLETEEEDEDEAL